MSKDTTSRVGFSSRAELFNPHETDVMLYETIGWETYLSLRVVELADSLTGMYEKVSSKIRDIPVESMEPYTTREGLHVWGEFWTMSNTVTISKDILTPGYGSLCRLEWVLRHELAHAIDFHLFGSEVSFGHSKEWERACVALRGIPHYKLDQDIVDWYAARNSVEIYSRPTKLQVPAGRD